jgi:hypothetical protein
MLAKTRRIHVSFAAERSALMRREGPALMPAIIGLLGVLVGAIITTGANYWLAERKEAAEVAKDSAGAGGLEPPNSETFRQGEPSSLIQKC